MEDRQVLRALARIGHRAAPRRPGLAAALGVQPDALIAPLADLERAGKVVQWQDHDGQVRVTLLARAGGRRARRRRRKTAVQLETDLDRPLSELADPRAEDPARAAERAEGVGSNGQLLLPPRPRVAPSHREPWPPCAWREPGARCQRADCRGGCWAWQESSRAGCSVYRCACAPVGLDRRPEVVNGRAHEGNGRMAEHTSGADLFRTPLWRQLSPPSRAWHSV